MNIFITGASRGIGKALVNEYAAQGHNVFLFARNEEQLKKLQDNLIDSKGIIEYFAGDVSDYDNYGRAIDTCKEIFGNIDLAILNAGMSKHDFLPGIVYDDFELVVRVNFLSYVYAINKLADIMKQQGYGKIAGVSSMADVRGFPGSSSYSASKAALTTFLESARSELKNLNIDIITIRPGFVRTDMTAKNKFHMPFLMDADRAAKIIIKNINSGKTNISFPKGTKYLTSFVRYLPDSLFNYFSAKSAKKELFVIDEKIK